MDKQDHFLYRRPRKKTTAILCLCLSVFIAFSGCGQSGAQQDSSDPAQTEPVADFPPGSALSSGGETFLTIGEDGSLWAWGDNQYGTEGDAGQSRTYKNPFKVMERAASVSASQWASFAVDRDGVLWGWGSNIWGQLGEGPTQGSAKPRRLMEDVLMASAGSQHALALKKDGSLWAWGVDFHGALGIGGKADPAKATDGKITEPIQVMENVRYAAASGNASYAITADSILWGWGDVWTEGGDESGTWNSPAKLMDGVVFASGDMGSILMIREDGNLWRLNQGVAGTDHPEKIMDDAVFCEAKNGRFACIRKDGGLWVWGDNAHGELGDGTTTRRDQPVKVMERVCDVTLDVTHTLAIDEDGTLWAMGYGLIFNGDIPEADRKPFYSPYQIMSGLRAAVPSTAGSGTTPESTVDVPTLDMRRFSLYGTITLLLAAAAILILLSKKKR